MVLHPGESLNSEDLKAQRNIFEQQLDEHIRRHEKHGYNTLPGFTVTSFAQVVIDDMVAKYRHAGWKITAGGDQREGNWITLRK